MARDRTDGLVEHVLQGFALYIVVDHAVQPVRQLPGLFLVETPERPRALAGECRHGVEGDGNRAGEYLSGGRYRVDDTRGQEHARNLVHARYAHVVAVKVQVRAAAREGHPVGKYRQAAHEGVAVVLGYRR